MFIVLEYFMKLLEILYVVGWREVMFCGVGIVIKFVDNNMYVWVLLMFDIWIKIIFIIKR